MLQWDGNITDPQFRYKTPMVQNVILCAYKNVCLKIVYSMCYNREKQFVVCNTFFVNLNNLIGWDIAQKSLRGVFQKYAERFHRKFAIAARLMIFHVRHA